MSVAYTINGEPIAYPATVVALRAKRMKAKDAPELLYSDGSPLILPVDTEFVATILDHVGDQFDDGEPVRVKLDPIDERGRVVEEVPAAYVQFHAPRPALPSPTDDAAASGGGNMEIVREAMRLNAAMAQTAIAKLPAIMEAAAHILAAADGAGLPARPPLALTEAARNGTDDERATPTSDTRPRNATAEMLHSVSEVLQHAQPYAKIAAMMFGNRAGIRNAVEVAFDDGKHGENAKGKKGEPDEEQNERATAAPAEPACDAPAAAAPASKLTDPAALSAHMDAINAQLTDQERSIARAAVAEMSPDEVAHWMRTLAAMSVDEAVAEIRRQVGGAS